MSRVLATLKQSSIFRIPPFNIMFLPSLLFDLAVFGGVLLALILDSAFAPLLHGALSVLVVGAFTYAAAQELCASSERRGLWSHESLATSLSVTTLLFFYYFGRNNSDFSLLFLSVGTMMVSLMAIIALIGAFSAAMHNRSATPFPGLVFTLFASLVLGALASLLLLALSSDASSPPLLPALALSSQASPLLKMLVPILGFALWKAREKARPPRENTPPTAQEIAASTRESDSYGQHSAPQTVLLSTRRGLLLDRFAPLLLLGALSFFLMKGRNAPTETPANAATTQSATTPSAASEVAR